jgi:histidyl-tRNA synthetase
MTNKDTLSTDSYKGVRDFYPEDMAIQRYIFDIWSQTAESYGFERYDASILEPSILYKSKGAENAEMVNEQTYTFIDRGGREVTLRPEMTPTVARMIAAKRRDLSFPVRWYSIPNLFRYERPQRGRLREHYQLNCDMFGANHYTADVEMIALANQMLLNFGADAGMFEIRVNNRATMRVAYNALGIGDDEKITAITRLNDKKNKIPADEYLKELTKITKDEPLAKTIRKMIDSDDAGDNLVVAGLKELGITNVKLDRSLARGFDYYTGTIFEIFDISGENNRAMLGGGRYDNLTELFGGEPISGIGFGMGDVTMRDFLATHGLLTSSITAPTLMILPTHEEYNLEAQKIAQEFRNHDISVSVDLSSKKVGKKISDASTSYVAYVLVLGEDEIKNKTYILKNLEEKTEDTGTLSELILKLSV